MERMEIVPMTKEHTAALAELERLCFSHPWSRKALEEEIQNPDACFFTAVEGNAVLGYAGMHCPRGDCYMDNIAVFPEHRGKGVATALLNALIGEAARRGGEFLSLEVRPSNTGAVRLYEKLGFREEGRRKSFYAAPVEDGLILTKRLSENEK